MAITRSMTRNKSYDASKGKMIKTFDKGGVAPWLDPNHDVIFLVIMQLGVVDFIAFSGVCKSWRSLALSNWTRFMASRRPMSIQIHKRPYKNECILLDFEGREFKTILPHSAGKTCVGLTCGYLILFGGKRRDFLLVNPITRHELHFPDATFYVSYAEIDVMPILVFLPSIPRWVFVVIDPFDHKIWFSIVGRGAWNHVSSTFPIIDLYAFKGKIYTLHTSHNVEDMRHLFEMKLDPEPKLTLLETNNFLKPSLYTKFLSSGENLYVMRYIRRYSFELCKLDFGEMKWVCCENTRKGYAFFFSHMNHSTVAVKPESWVQYERYVGIDKSRNGTIERLNNAHMWYFFHDCLNVNSYTSESY